MSWLSSLDETTPPPPSVAQSPLWKLPPEVRTHIYNYVVYRPAWYGVTRRDVVAEAGLLLTCKIVRQEVLRLIYDLDRFP